MHPLHAARNENCAVVCIVAHVSDMNFANLFRYVSPFSMQRTRRKGRPQDITIEGLEISIIGALLMKIGLWGPLCYDYHTGPPYLGHYIWVPQMLAAAAGAEAGVFAVTIGIRGSLHFLILKSLYF